MSLYCDLSQLCNQHKNMSFLWKGVNRCTIMSSSRIDPHLDLMPGCHIARKKSGICVLKCICSTNVDKKDSLSYQIFQKVWKNCSMIYMIPCLFVNTNGYNRTYPDLVFQWVSSPDPRDPAVCRPSPSLLGWDRDSSQTQMSECPDHSVEGRSADVTVTHNITQYLKISVIPRVPEFRNSMRNLCVPFNKYSGKRWSCRCFFSLVFKWYFHIQDSELKWLW